jgi:cytochrome b6-f complex iron-sulfur subunit
MPKDERKSPTTPPEAGSEEGVMPADLTRRKLIWGGLGAAAAVYAGALGYPVYRYLADPAEEAAELAKVTEMELPEEELPAAGSATILQFGARKAILIRHDDDTMVCFSAVCTHLGCTVAYQADQDRIYCACHGGVYDPRTGQNVSGPPPRPLEEFNVERLDGKVVIRRA